LPWRAGRRRLGVAGELAMLARNARQDPKPHADQRDVHDRDDRRRSESDETMNTRMPDSTSPMRTKNVSIDRLRFVLRSRDVGRNSA
jgi:hypothetical protein